MYGDGLVMALNEKIFLHRSDLKIEVTSQYDTWAISWQPVGVFCSQNISIVDI